MTTTPDYVLGRTSHEYRRLRTQSKLWEPATARLLDDAGVRHGHALPGRRLRAG